MKRPTFEEWKKKVLKDPAVKAEYDRLGPEYEHFRQLLKMRTESELTQEEKEFGQHEKENSHLQD